MNNQISLNQISLNQISLKGALSGCKILALFVTLIALHSNGEAQSVEGQPSKSGAVLCSDAQIMIYPAPPPPVYPRINVSASGRNVGDVSRRAVTDGLMGANAACAAGAYGTVARLSTVEFSYSSQDSLPIEVAGNISYCCAKQTARVNAEAPAKEKKRRAKRS